MNGLSFDNEPLTAKSMTDAELEEVAKDEEDAASSGKRGVWRRDSTEPAQEFLSLKRPTIYVVLTFQQTQQ